jgi:hypothetical protein
MPFLSAGVRLFPTEGPTISRTPDSVHRPEMTEWLRSIDLHFDARNRNPYEHHGSGKKRSLDSALRTGQQRAEPGDAFAVGAGDQPVARRERSDSQDGEKQLFHNRERVELSLAPTTGVLQLGFLIENVILSAAVTREPHCTAARCSNKTLTNAFIVYTLPTPLVPFPGIFTSYHLDRNWRKHADC